MNKKTAISKATSKVMLSLVYFLFFTVQLHFQYQSASSVDFVDNTVAVHHANPHLHASGKTIQQDVSYTKHNRLNKRYHPEWPVAIVNFFDYSSPVYSNTTSQYFSVAYSGSNIFLSTYLLRGPPANTCMI